MTKVRYGTHKKYHFFYKTTHTTTGRYYYGIHSTNNLGDGYIGSGKRLKYSINKYGKQNHKIEILEFFNSREELISHEAVVVDLDEVAKENCLNLAVGGVGGSSGRVWDPKTIKNLSQKNREFWLNASDTWKKRKSERASNTLKKLWKEGGTWSNKHHIGSTRSAEAKERMRKASLGKKNSQFGTQWITDGTISKKLKKSEAIPIGFRLGRVISKLS